METPFLDHKYSIFVSGATLISSNLLCFQFGGIVFQRAFSEHGVMDFSFY